MWTPTARLQHSRTEIRYSTDLTDWGVIEALLPPACRLGRPRLWSMREIVNGIFYVMCGGIAWRLLPKDLPPKSTVYGHLQSVARQRPVRRHQPPPLHAGSRAGRTGSLAECRGAGQSSFHRLRMRASIRRKAAAPEAATRARR